MVCLDTTFLIDVIRGKKEVSEIEDELIESQENISVAAPSIIELFKGLYLKENIRYATEKEIAHIDKILSTFNILELDKSSASLAGKMEAELLNCGEKIDIEDIMIGAIAIHNGEVLLTRNVKHFERIDGLKIEGY